MKARIAILLSVVALLCCSCGGKFKEIKVTSCELKSLNPIGFSKMEAVLKLTVDNPAAELHLNDIKGVVKYDGEPCLTLTVPDIVIDGKKESIYMVTVTGQIDRGFDILKIISVIRDKAAMEDATLDVNCRAELSSGLGKDIAKKDIPLKDLIDKL